MGIYLDKSAETMETFHIICSIHITLCYNRLHSIHVEYFYPHGGGAISKIIAKRLGHVAGNIYLYKVNATGLTAV